MAGERRAGLEAADPRVGQTLRFEGADWEVTDHSSYWSDDGYRVNEWECESEDSQAYLLKEIHEGAPIRWFFTRQIEPDGVTLPGGETLPRWLQGNRSAEPPAALTFRGQTYEYDESTEGTYEDEPGKRVRKTTWEYWDAGDAHNLAVEVWASGDLHCYHGAYIEPGQVALEGGPEPSAGAAGLGGAAAMGLAAGLARTAAGSGRVSGLVANPFVAAAACVPFAYVIPFFMGWPFDKSIGVALCLAGLAGWVFALFRAPLAAALALLAAPVVLVAFWRFPPLTSAVGLAAVLAAPAAVIWLGGRRYAPARLPVIYTAAFAVAGPALVLGVYHYFRFAPGPHTLGQLALALGPAAVGGLAAGVVAAMILSATAKSPS